MDDRGMGARNGNSLSVEHNYSGQVVFRLILVWFTLHVAFQVG